jgi:hypothetical protein
MTLTFRELVTKMRKIQKQYDKGPSQFLLIEKKRLEESVDRWLEKNTREVESLAAWERSVKSTETPGAYNVPRDERQEDFGDT